VCDPSDNKASSKAFEWNEARPGTTIASNDDEDFTTRTYVFARSCGLRTNLLVLAIYPPRIVIGLSAISSLALPRPVHHIFKVQKR
jgi:hypothetical protein